MVQRWARESPAVRGGDCQALGGDAGKGLAGTAICTQEQSILTLILPICKACKLEEGAAGDCDVVFWNGKIVSSKITSREIYTRLESISRHL
jgi:hypothetical protein